MDQDLHIEFIQEVRTNNGTLLSISVRDFQDGDVDFSYNGDQDGAPGFTSDIDIYTEVATGTYLRLEEGKLFSPSSGQYIRTASKKNTVDIISRYFKLSNDTGRLCTGPFTRNRAMPSVEACGACFGRNITRTCVEIDTDVNEDAPFLYIRSRIKDYHGHKWVTETTGDPYIEFLK